MNSGSAKKGSAEKGSVQSGPATSPLVSGHCVIAVDVGNSAAKLLVEASDGNKSCSFRIDQSDWAPAAVQWVRDHTGCERMLWRIASVHRGAAARLSAVIGESDPDAEIRLVSRHDMPLEIDVEFPDRVGIDRLVGAYAALGLATPPLIVVDAGSAVTVDWIDASGRFCGGAILPGLRLQTTSLATGTDALPDLDWLDERPLAIPGRNTLQAIRLGVLTGVAAGIDRLVGAYTVQANSAGVVKVLVTGGDATALSPHMRSTHGVEPNLVCRGLLRLPANPPSEPAKPF